MKNYFQFLACSCWSLVCDSEGGQRQARPDYDSRRLQRLLNRVAGW